jgi:type IV secretion system protein TrbB
VDRDGTYERQLAKLRKDLGEVFLAALADPDTVEIMLNADGALWCERLGEQIRPIGTMTGNSAEAAMRTIAAYHHATITRDNHSIECELPLDGSRFAGQIPPIVSTPVFAVRKGASRVFTLGQYVAAGIMTAEQKRTLVVAIRDHRNILATSSTGSGKNDTPEWSIRELTVPMALRMRAGRMRGPEALDLLMAWNTGHEGGIATLHANNAAAGLTRLSTLVSMPRSAVEGHAQQIDKHHCDQEAVVCL